MDSIIIVQKSAQYRLAQISPICRIVEKQIYDVDMADRGHSSVT